MDGPLKLSAQNTLVLDLRSLGSGSPNARGFSSRYTRWTNNRGPVSWMVPQALSPRR